MGKELGALDSVCLQAWFTRAVEVVATGSAGAAAAVAAEAAAAAAAAEAVVTVSGGWRGDAVRICGSS